MQRIYYLFAMHVKGTIYIEPYIWSPTNLTTHACETNGENFECFLIGYKAILMPIRLLENIFEGLVIGY